MKLAVIKRIYVSFTKWQPISFKMILLLLHGKYVSSDFFFNLLNFAKRSNISDYWLSLSQAQILVNYVFQFYRKIEPSWVFICSRLSTFSSKLSRIIFCSFSYRSNSILSWVSFSPFNLTRFCSSVSTLKVS